ncbi:MAG TPA: hypothetical protein VMI31_06400 [Fimbriimonadaceae bacterium]|nr:hypothetical protein [Fimbriimonadaceae bacterium]
MPDQAGLLTRLLERIPPYGASADPDEQTRSALRPLVERAVALDSNLALLPPGESAGSGNACPNCGQPVGSLRSPYCSEKCKETAAFVRQFRNSLANESIFEPERMADFGQKWWHLQGGGYPRRQLMVPAKTIAKVIARANGACEICGAPATEIDHAGSG